MTINMITDRTCYGCMLCMDICSKNAISMKEDDFGFLYPSVQLDLCVNCGLCKRKCIANKQDYRTKDDPLACFGLTIKDVDALHKSASGGAAYALGYQILKEGGVVYGVAYGAEFMNSQFIRVETFDQLYLLQGSKYIKATNICEIYKKIETDISNGLKVLAIALPCEIAAIKRKLGEKDGLFLVDIICHGVTSAKAHRLYILEKSKGKRIKFFTIKDKKNGWKPNTTITLELEDGDKVQEPLYCSDYGYVFSHLSRLSCYNCNFKGMNRASDICLGDFWGVENSKTDYNRDGVSLVIVNTKKGERILENCSSIVDKWTTDFKTAIDNNQWYNKHLFYDHKNDVYRKKFIKNEKIYVPNAIKIINILKRIKHNYQNGECSAKDKKIR